MRFHQHSPPWDLAGTAWDLGGTAWDLEGIAWDLEGTAWDLEGTAWDLASSSACQENPKTNHKIRINQTQFM